MIGTSSSKDERTGDTADQEQQLNNEVGRQGGVGGRKRGCTKEKIDRGSVAAARLSMKK